MPVNSTTLANDQGRFIQDKLLERSELMMKLEQFTEKVPLPNGNGETAEFIKYNRTDVPVDQLEEGVTPQETTFSISRQTITIDKWGMYITLTDVAEVTTKHPVLNEAMDLVGDAMARCVDYNIAEVLNDGTNTQFWDGSRATRADITSTDNFEAAVFNKARADMNDGGATPRAGDLFIIVCGPQVEADILAETAAIGSFAATAQQQSKDKMEKGKVGDWLGFRIIRSNFMPKFTRISTFSSVAAAAGGALSGTVYHKVTRKSLTRGFEEDIQVQNSTAMGSDTRLTFTAPSTAGYVYNIYAGTTTGDSTLFLARENLQPSGVYHLDAVPTSGNNPPTTPAASITVHPMYIFGAKAVDNVEISALNLGAGITPKARTDSDPLAQRRKVGAKWNHKAGIRNSFATKRIELVSAF